MKKRILSLLLTLVVILGMIPATTLTASAASTNSILVDGVDMSDGTYLAVGASNTTTSKPSGGYAYWKDDVLTLNNFEIYGAGLISCETSFTLYLEGTNTITRPKNVVESKTGAINCTAGSLTIEGDGVLNVTNYGDGIDVAINMYINGGSLRISGQRWDKNYYTQSSEGIKVDGSLYINGGYIYAGGVQCGACRATAVHFNGGIVHLQCDDSRHLVLADDGNIYETGDPVYLVRDEDYTIKEWSLSDMRSHCAPEPYYDPDLFIPHEVIVIGEIEFANQFPEMPAGQTTHNLGKVSSSEYVMTFGSQDTPSSIGVGGYKVIEKLVVYDRDNNGEIVDTVTNNPQLSGTGISYSLKNLPSGNYTIRESITLYDKDGKALLGNNNDFILEVERTVNTNINVSATFSGTPAKATTSTTGATVTATKWYRKNGSGWTELGASDTIKEGNTYRCEVTVGATGDYKLADGYTVKINGTAATKKSGNTWYRDVTITGYTSYVDVYDIALPEAGAKPDFTFNDVECRYSSVALVEWFECDKDGKKLSGALSADYKFKEDSYYRLEVTVVPDANYKFDTRDLDFYINGKAAQYYYPYQDTTYPDSVTGWKVYHVDDANGTYTIQIGDITLKDGDYLANNATAVTTSKPVGGYACYKDGVLTLNNFVSKNLIRYYERYLEVELIGDNKIGAIADYYYWDGNASNNYYTGLEFRGDGNLDFGYYSDKPYSNVSVNGDVFFNGSGNISLDAEIYCFQFTDNVIINDGYVSCYCAQSNVFSGNANITVNGGKLQMTDGGCWYGSFICEDNLLIYAGNVYVSVDPRKIELADCVPWDGVTNLNTYDCVWIVKDKTETTLTGSTTGGVKVAVENLKDSGTLIVAQYNGGKMVDVEMQTVSADGTYTMDQLTHKTGCTYKAFLVNSTSYAPLCEADDF